MEEDLSSLNVMHHREIQAEKMVGPVEGCTDVPLGFLPLLRILLAEQVPSKLQLLLHLKIA